MFEFIDRNEKESIVLIPGWAFDYRIFKSLDLKYNYFLYGGKSITGFEAELKEILTRNNIDKISLFGWSQGAFTACDFACRNSGIVDELILISVKRKYERESLEKIKKYLRKNKAAYLYKFYAECFHKEENSYQSWFKRNLLKDYLREMEAEDLIEGLEVLSQDEIKPEFLSDIKKIKIIHGRNDNITPISGALDIKKGLPWAELIVLENTGHIPFLRKNFGEHLYA